MELRKLSIALLAVMALALTACAQDQGAEGGAEEAEVAADDTAEPDAGPTGEAQATEAAEDEGADAELAGALDCNAVEVIVPYSPGGGSDQQVRRLQPALEEGLGTRLNINYQTGGDGSVGWNALANADPDGCTIANVVLPNISNLSLTAGEEVGFSAEEFEYIAFTEYSPNIIGVAQDAEWETIEDYIADAEARPGEITISGVGVNGELLVSEVLDATGIDLTYVPVSGGVGDIIPQIAGGHIDSAISGFSLLDGDQVRPLALSAPAPDLPDVPTFEEAGYPGVQLVTSWGFILPPGASQDIVETWNAAVQQALNDPEVQQAYAETSFIVLEQTPEEARDYFEEQHEATQRAVERMDSN